MCGYAIGILGIGLKEILDRALYAIGNTKTSAVNGVIIMGANISLSLVLMHFFGAYGIPLAYSVASLIGMCVLLFKIKRQVGTFAKGLGMLIVKCIIASVVMLLAVEGLNLIMPAGSGIVDRCIKLIVPVGAGLVVYYIMALILKIKPVTEFTAKILKRGKQ